MAHARTKHTAEHTSQQHASQKAAGWWGEQEDPFLFGCHNIEDADGYTNPKRMATTLTDLYYPCTALPHCLPAQPTYPTWEQH